MTMKLKVALDHEGSKIELTLPDDLQIHEAKLNPQVAEQPGLYAFYSIVAARLSARTQQAAQLLRDVQAQREIHIRQAAAATGEKMTEDKIKAKLQIDPDVQKARDSFALIERMSLEAAQIKEAFYQRLQALITLSANVRKEYSQQSST
jgi:hypothetical protein